MKITNICAVPISCRVPEGNKVRLGIGRAVKRDAVLVKVETNEGIVGWGESHHGRCPGAIAKLIDTTISELALGMAASIHMPAAADNAGYFEGDVAAYNPFRDNFGGIPYALDQNGCVRPLEEPGIGIVVNEDFLAAHPLIDGPCYV